MKKLLVTVLLFSILAMAGWAGPWALLVSYNKSAGYACALESVRLLEPGVHTKIYPDGMNWSYSSFLTSIRGKDYLLNAVGGVDAEIIRKGYREERKSKFLSPQAGRRLPQ